MATKAKNTPDAGLRSLDHYKNRLPRWRYKIRERLLPIVRWETPYVAWLQDTMRTPFLDGYFAMMANLGTHTFFMIILPILYWCGNPRLARGMVNTLAAGVLFSGMVKDFLCLPRPLSPPLSRITMSGSTALEYGFPSTHSTNAVSTAVYSIFLLREGNSSPTTLNIFLQCLAVFYASSIVLGRLYCGMHGFFDVIWGTLLGLAIGTVQIMYGDAFDVWLLGSEVKNVVLVVLIILVLIRVHPEPADDCPCFDDSVAFTAVVIGCQIGQWHFARTSWSSDVPIPGTAHFDLQQMGWIVAAARIASGVVVVFAWRAVMKPTLLKTLPPVFRFIEHYGLTLPRRYFLPASQYTRVPKQKDDDNVIPSAREIPGLLSNLRRRGRAISIGPQSEADVYEALAYREKRRRDSINASSPSRLPLKPKSSGYSEQEAGEAGTVKTGRPRSSSLDQYEAQMGETTSPSAGPLIAAAKGSIDEARTDQELFAHVHKPRVRYDVEVITKLVVYVGIAWFATEGNPVIFELIGLGLK